jgi:protease-4
VWAGNDAIKIGLVDELGGIDDAIKYAAKSCGLDKYRIVYLPKQKEPLEELLNHLSGNEESIRETALKNSLGDQYIYYQYLKEMMGMKGIQARMGYEIIIE